MKIKTKSGQLNKKAVMLIAASAVIGFLLGGLRIQEFASETQVSINQFPNGGIFVIERPVLYIEPAIIFGFFAAIAAFFIIPYIPEPDQKKLEEITNRFPLTKNQVLFTVFLMLWFLIIVLLEGIANERLSMTNEAKRGLIFKSSLLIGFTISYIAIGRKVRFPLIIRSFTNWLLLGPFNYYKAKKINSTQQKILWVSFLILIFLALNPPWYAYKSTINDEPSGEPTYVGFHLIGSRLLSVVGKAPYMTAEPVWSLQLILIGVFIVIASIVFVCTGIKTKPNRQSGDDALAY